MPRAAALARPALLAIAAATALAAPAQAQRRGTDPAWQVGEMAAGASCFAAMDYEGGTLLMLVAHANGMLGVAVGSRAGMVEEGSHYPLRWELGGSRRATDAVGIRSAGRRGYAALVEPDFVGDLARAASVRIVRPDGSLLEILGLKGSADAVRRLRACVARLRSGATPQIPAPPAGWLLYDAFRRGAAFPRRAGANIAPLLSDDDYPAAALRAEEQGRVRFRMEINAEGRVSACTIVESSGSNSLDSAACRIVQRRARFVPALDERGQPVADTAFASILWRIPEDGEPAPPPPPTKPPGG